MFSGKPEESFMCWGHDWGNRRESEHMIGVFKVPFKSFTCVFYQHSKEFVHSCKRIFIRVC